MNEALPEPRRTQRDLDVDRFRALDGAQTPSGENDQSGPPLPTTPSALITVIRGLDFSQTRHDTSPGAGDTM